MGWAVVTVMIEPEHQTSPTATWQRITELMAPYSIDREVEPYLDSCGWCGYGGPPDPDCGHCEGTGEAMVTYNPQSRWNYYESDADPDPAMTLPLFLWGVKVPFLKRKISSKVGYAPENWESLAPNEVSHAFLSEGSGWISDLPEERGTTGDYEGDWENVFSRESDTLLSQGYQAVLVGIRH